MTTSEITQAPVTVVCNNRSYTFRLIDQDAKAEFERQLYLEKKGRAKSAYDLGIDTEEEYTASLELLKQQFKGGQFSLLAPEGVRKLQSGPDGAIMLLKILGNCSEGELIGILLSRGRDGMVETLTQIIQASFPGFDARSLTTSDPKV